jgi:hypothetical protein
MPEPLYTLSLRRGSVRVRLIRSMYDLPNLCVDTRYLSGFPP